MRLFRQQRSEVSKREATLTVKNPTLKRFIRVQFLVKFYFYEYAYQLHFLLFWFWVDAEHYEFDFKRCGFESQIENKLFKLVILLILVFQTLN